MATPRSRPTRPAPGARAHGDGGRRGGEACRELATRVTRDRRAAAAGGRPRTWCSKTGGCASAAPTGACRSPRSRTSGTARRSSCPPTSIRRASKSTAGYKAARDTGTFSYACHAVRGRGRHRDRRRRDPGLRRRRGRRQAGEPDDRRRPGARRRGAGHRHRALRGDAVRRAGPAAGRDARRLPAARHDRGAGDPLDHMETPSPLHRLRPEGHRRGRRHRAARRDRRTRSTTRCAARRRDAGERRSRRGGCSRRSRRRGRGTAT